MSDLFGIAVRRAMGDVREYCDDLLVAKAAGLMYGYVKRWEAEDRELVVQQIEGEYLLPLRNYRSKRGVSRTFAQAGKYDGIVEKDGRRLLLEHKTTNQEIADSCAPYWQVKAFDSQSAAYQLASWQNGNKLDGTLWDAIRKPGINPKALSKKASAQIIETGKYCGFDVQTGDAAEVVAGAARETPGLYLLRLCRETLDNSERYYQRRIVAQLNGQLLEWGKEQWDVAQDIRQANRTGRHYKNTSACMTYGVPCEYLGLCCGTDTPESDRWTVGNEVHVELEGASASTLEVLTPSRLRCFQTCRMKHHYRYNLRLRRSRDQDSESLRFGSLLHAGLEAYFLALMEGESNGDSHETDNLGKAEKEVLAK